MTASPTADLDRLLEEEKAALLGGNYAHLERIAAQKEACLAQLTTAAPDIAKLRQIKKRMQENQDLTASALKGVQAARTRWAALEKVRDGLTTYDLSGKVAIVPTQQSRVEKKA